MPKIKLPFGIEEPFTDISIDMDVLTLDEFGIITEYTGQGWMDFLRPHSISGKELTARLWYHVHQKNPDVSLADVAALTVTQTFDLYRPAPNPQVPATETDDPEQTETFEDEVPEAAEPGPISSAERLRAAHLTLTGDIPVSS